MKNKQDKYNPFFIIAISLFLFGVYFLLSYQNSSSDMKIEPTNYRALVQAGLAPTTQSRAVTERDLDTNLRINYNGQVLALYESRNWNTLDYGKTFLVRVS